MARCLILCDEEERCLLHGLMEKNCGYSVETFDSTKDAIRRFETYENTPTTVTNNNADNDDGRTNAPANDNCRETQQPFLDVVIAKLGRPNSAVNGLQTLQALRRILGRQAFFVLYSFTAANDPPLRWTFAEEGANMVTADLVHLEMVARKIAAIKDRTICPAVVRLIERDTIGNMEKVSNGNRLVQEKGGGLGGKNLDLDVAMQQASMDLDGENSMDGGNGKERKSQHLHHFFLLESMLSNLIVFFSARY